MSNKKMARLDYNWIFEIYECNYKGYSKNTIKTIQKYLKRHFQNTYGDVTWDELHECEKIHFACSEVRKYMLNFISYEEKNPKRKQIEKKVDSMLKNSHEQERVLLQRARATQYLMENFYDEDKIMAGDKSPYEEFKKAFELYNKVYETNFTIPTYEEWVQYKGLRIFDCIQNQIHIYRYPDENKKNNSDTELNPAEPEKPEKSEESAKPEEPIKIEDIIKFLDKNLSPDMKYNNYPKATREDINDIVLKVILKFLEEKYGFHVDIKKIEECLNYLYTSELENEIYITTPIKPDSKDNSDKNNTSDKAGTLEGSKKSEYDEEYARYLEYQETFKNLDFYTIPEDDKN